MWLRKTRDVPNSDFMYSNTNTTKYWDTGHLIIINSLASDTSHGEVSDSFRRPGFVRRYALVFPSVIVLRKNRASSPLRQLESYAVISTCTPLPAAHLITAWPWRLTFWPRGQCMPKSCYILCTRFGVDSSSRFPFTLRTHTHTHKVTDATDHL